ncbi:hypothetical protein [Campylobacter helveticus]|nr:hypothetical protein [Campylobacter helveticus]
MINNPNSAIQRMKNHLLLLKNKLQSKHIKLGIREAMCGLFSRL